MRKIMEEKLALLSKLALPPLAGKSFLDMGCGSGFFCGYAIFEGACKVMGIDCDAEAISDARSNFPNGKFFKYDDLANELLSLEKFDVILFSSRFACEMSFARFLKQNMERLQPRGTAILTIDIVKDDYMAREKTSEGLPINVNGLACFASSQINKLLHPFVYKIMGEFVAGENPEVVTKIIHLKNPSPYAILLLGKSGSGKSTTVARIFPGFPAVHGDRVMYEIACMAVNQLVEKFPYLNKICGHPELSVGGIMIEIFNSAAGKEYARYVAEYANYTDFVYDGTIHENFQNVFIKQLEALGYHVLTVNTPDPEISPNELFKMGRNESRKYRLFLETREELKNIRQLAISRDGEAP